MSPSPSLFARSFKGSLPLAQSERRGALAGGAPGAQREMSASPTFSRQSTCARSYITGEIGPLAWKKRYRHAELLSATRRSDLSKRKCRQSDWKGKKATPRKKQQTRLSLVSSSLSLPDSKLTCSPFLGAARTTTRAEGRAVVIWTGLRREN